MFRLQGLKFMIRPNPAVSLSKMSSPFIDSQGNTIPPDHILGSGNTAVVLFQNGLAVKTPLRYRWSSDSNAEVNLQSIRQEQDVYRRLQNSEDSHSRGVVHCVKFTFETTKLVYLPNRDLHTYLLKYNTPCQLQL